MNLSMHKFIYLECELLCSRIGMQIMNVNQNTGECECCLCTKFLNLAPFHKPWYLGSKIACSTITEAMLR